MSPERRPRREDLALGDGPASDAPSRIIDVPRGGDGPAARMRFCFGARGGHLSVWPDWTWLADPVPSEAQAAVGDIEVVDDDHCIASIALASRFARPRAEEVLRWWARADDWRLEILPGTHPLRVPFDAAARSKACTRCDARGWIGAVAAPYRATAGWYRTRCSSCRRGRMLPISRAQDAAELRALEEERRRNPPPPPPPAPAPAHGPDLDVIVARAEALDSELEQRVASLDRMGDPDPWLSAAVATLAQRGLADEGGEAEFGPARVGRVTIEYRIGDPVAKLHHTEDEARAELRQLLEDFDD